jgi:hypothetical protein
MPCHFPNPLEMQELGVKKLKMLALIGQNNLTE